MLLGHWIADVEELSAAALTVDAQTAPDLNQDDQLMHEALAPALAVPSVQIKSLSRAAFRPVGGRRTWNLRGRQIPIISPDVDEIEIEPVETYFTIDEREIQTLEERYGSNNTTANANVTETLIRDYIKADVPTRTRELVEANRRRVELDLFEAIVNRVVTVRNPQDNTAYVVPLGFSNDRYGAAGTPWTDAGVKPFRELLAVLQAYMPLVGGIRGVLLRTPVIREIQADAPALANGEPMGLAALQNYISQEIGSPFRFYNMDNLPPLDDFVNGGTTTQPVNRYPSVGKITLLPADGRVGRVAEAPIGRAQALVRQLVRDGVTDSGINSRDWAVFPESINNGRELNVECQGNKFPLLNEKRLAVFDTGITA